MSNSTDLSKNPLYRQGWPPAFDQVEPAHVEPAITALLAEATEAFEEAERNLAPTWEGSVLAIDRLSWALNDAWRIVSHLHGVHNSPALREAHEAVLPAVVTFGLRANQSRPLYEALKTLKESEAFASLEPGMQRVVEARVLEMELGGVGLEGEARERFNAIATRLSNLASSFSNNVLDATQNWEKIIRDRNELKGLSDDDLGMLAQSYERVKNETATAQEGPWRLSLDTPSMRPILENCENRPLRELLYRASIARAGSGEQDNGPLIDEILSLRREMAGLLGYANFGELSMTQKMATVDSARGLLLSLREASSGPGKKEFEELQAFAQAQGHTGELAPWDVRFYRMKLRDATYNFSAEELRSYFPLPRVLQGLWTLVEKLFGVEVREAPGLIPIWHPDVRTFQVFENGAPIAAFTLDPFARPAEKRGGAWMADARTPRRGAPDPGFPVAHLVCNGTPPVGDRPSLMSFEEVTTLFHEFGHGIHHMLSRVDIEAVSGTNGVEWDAIELPSQFMENWCYHRETLQGMTAHVDTGEPLPDELFEKLSASRTFFAGLDFLRQLQFGLMDLELHTRFDASRETPLQVQQRIFKETSPIPVLDEDRMLNAFGHIFAGGYSAGYYSYKWAEVLSADAFEAFVEVGLDNPEALQQVGRRYRDTVLALGGSLPPAQVWQQFRGREATIDALLRHNGLSA